jgi:hypothetical protein
VREEQRLRVCENRVFRAKREEDGSWKKLHNYELHSLYSSLNIFRMIKLKRMRLVGPVAHMGQGRGFYGVWLGGLKVGDQWEDIVVGGRITLKWTIWR